MAGGVGVFLRGKGSGDFEEVWPTESGIVISDDARGVVPLDFNGDGATDLAIALNNGPVKILLNNDLPGNP